MLSLNVTGDEAIMRYARTADSRGLLRWKVREQEALGSPSQLRGLAGLVGLKSMQDGALPPGFSLHTCPDKRSPGDVLKLDRTPSLNGLRAGDYIYISYKQPASPVHEDDGHEGDSDFDSLDYEDGVESGDGVGPTYSNERIRNYQAEQFAQHAPSNDNLNADAVRALQSQLDVKQGQLEELGQRLQLAEGQNQELRRQLLQVSEQLQTRGGSLPLYSSPASPSRHSRVTSPESPDTLARLREKNRELGLQLAETRKKLHETEMKLEAVEAWKAQHDCRIGAGNKPSDLRQEMEEMRNTMRDIVRHREESKRSIAERRRQITDQYSAQKQKQDSMLGEAKNTIGKNGAQLMPSPYYMDPYMAPASCYQVAPGNVEGTVCKLKVQTQSGEGTVVRRVYSALTRNNQHVMVLSSLEGVVTDEIVAEELEQAGVGYNRPDLLYLATARHRWVLSMETMDRRQWLQWLSEVNPKLKPQGNPFGLPPHPDLTSANSAAQHGLLSDDWAPPTGAF